MPETVTAFFEAFPRIPPSGKGLWAALGDVFKGLLARGVTAILLQAWPAAMVQSADSPRKTGDSPGATCRGRAPFPFAHRMSPSRRRSEKRRLAFGNSGGQGV